MTPDELTQDCINKLNEANTRRASGDFDRAIAICSELIGIFPDYWAALHTLGLAYSDKQDYRRALDCLVRAAIVYPDNWKTLSALAETYMNLGALKLAVRTIESAIAVAGVNADLCYMQGEIYRRDIRYSLAEAAYARALDLEPGFLSAMMGRALCLAEMGQLEAAARLHEALIAADPGFFEALAELANLPSRLWKIDVPATIAAHQDELPRHNDDFKASFHFAHAAALHAARRYGEAWTSWLAGNAILHERMRPELKQTSEFQRIFREKLPAFVSSSPPEQVDQSKTEDGPFSLFLLGPSRCGKSTAESLLGRLDGFCPGYETLMVEDSLNDTCALAGLPVISSDHLPHRLFASFRDIYRKQLGQRAGAARVFMNTNPTVVKDIVLLLKAVPDTRVIFIKRNLRDNVFRIFSKQYGVGNPFAYDVRVIRDYVLWYNACIDIVAAGFPGAVRVIDYEDMVSDPRLLYRVTAELLPVNGSGIEVADIGSDRGCSEPYAAMIAPLLAV